MKKPLRVFRLPIGFIIDEDGKILFLKRKDRQSREPVKGGIESKETPKEAVLREFFEETGLDTTDILSFEDFGERKSRVEKDHEIIDRHIYIFFIKIKGKSPFVKINHIQSGGEDHEDYGWFVLEELKIMNLDGYSKFIISEIESFQKREEDNKIFNSRNEQKKVIHKNNSDIYFREGDIRRCSLGMNIRSESYGKGDSFRRPILVLKKLSADFCIAIPLSSKNKQGTWFCDYSLHGEIGTALLYQIKAIHKNRFQRKIGELDEKDFQNIKKKLSELLNLS